MDQLKVFLQQAIKYRFWIVVGVAALMPIIAYTVAAGSIAQKTEEETSAIKGSQSKVQPYATATVPNGWAPLVEERTKVLTKDVNAAWRKLYERQAPLLTWPPEVSDRMIQWGRKWPESVDPARVAETVNIYAQVYPQYVHEVYESFEPFDFKTGDGVVVAPPEKELLRPATFSVSNPPTLGKVWAAQERLWIQRTVLDVIDKVNGEAKAWTGAPVKQINELEVAAPKALDQLTVAQAKGEEILELAPEIAAPDDATATTSAPAASDTSGMTQEEKMMASMMQGSAMMQSGYPGGMGSGMGGPGTASTEPEDVYIVKPQSEGQQYQVVPIFLSVMIEQQHIPDLLVSFEQSPMSIQVLEIEIQRPSERIKKPEKGDQQPMLGGYGMMMGGMREMGGMMMSPGMYPGGYQDMGMMNEMANMGVMGPGGYPGMGGGVPKRPGGTDITTEQLKKLEERKKKDQEKKAEKKKSDSIADPYFNVVEVRIYGQARFYEPPPPVEEEAPASETAELTETPATDTNTETPSTPENEAPVNPMPAMPGNPEMIIPGAPGAQTPEAPKAEVIPEPANPSTEPVQATEPETGETPQDQEPAADTPKVEQTPAPASPTATNPSR